MIISNKSIKRDVRNNHAHGPKHHPSQDKGSWYSSRNTSAHLQQVEIKPWVREGTQLDLLDITENKVTPRIMKGFIVG
jgi:hypothetical protein